MGVARFLGGSLIAIEFLTPLRLRPVQTYDDRTFAEALGWYPFAGLVLGAILAALDRGLGELLPVGPAAALLVAALALLSGGLHLDGVADTADGLAVQGDRNRRLAVMREGTIGPAGVMALVLVLLTEWSAIASLPADARTAALIVAPALARWTVAPVGLLFAPARPGGLGHAIHAGLWPLAAPFATALAAVIALVTFALAGLAILVAAAVGALVTAGAAARMLGGVTGDVYGAAIEVAQVVAWLAILAGLHQGWFEPVLTV
ncbi:MAG: adenosylcobinamide-GDP ribazoletransferase [Dehalococcoidia bacterium]|nr:adenosylcobinamide-GDP ribazoletransferase [Dehalococcoidia bacterium]